MKPIRSLQVLILVLTTLVSCTKNNDILKENSIIGTWQLVERFDGGSPNPIQTIENGEIIVFNADFSYSNNSYDCDGSFTVNNSFVYISMPCVSVENLTYSFSFENSNLLLTNVPSTCDEGCYDKYKKITY